MALFELFPAAETEGDQSDMKSGQLPEPRVLNPAEVMAVAGGPTSQNDG